MRAKKGEIERRMREWMSKRLRENKWNDRETTADDESNCCVTVKIVCLSNDAFSLWRHLNGLTSFCFLLVRLSVWIYFSTRRNSFFSSCQHQIFIHLSCEFWNFRIGFFIKFKKWIKWSFNFTWNSIRIKVKCETKLPWMNKRCE